MSHMIQTSGILCMVAGQHKWSNLLMMVNNNLSFVAHSRNKCATNTGEVQTLCGALTPNTALLDK